MEGTKAETGKSYIVLQVQFVTNLSSCGSDSCIWGQLPSMLPLPPTQVSSLWSAVSWKLGRIIDIATITLCAEWAYTTLWTCFSCPLHPPFSEAMCLLVKTGFRCQLYGWSSGSSADVCPNPPPEIRLRPVDHPFEWPQPRAQGALSLALHQQQHCHYCLRADSQLKACQQLASLLEKQKICTCCTCASQTCLSSEFHLPRRCVHGYLGFRKPSLPQQVWDSSPKCWLGNREAHFVTLSQNSTANLGWAWVLEQIQSCLFGVCGWICGLFFSGFFFLLLLLAGWVWGFSLFLSIWHNSKPFQWKDYSAVHQTVPHPH